MTLIVFIPLYMKYPLFRVSGSFVSIRLEDLLILSTYFVWSLYILISKKYKTLLADKLFVAILVFLFVGLISSYFSSFGLQTTTFKLSVLHLLRRAELILLMPVAYTTIKNNKQIFKYLLLLFIVTSIVGVYALGQRYASFPALTTINTELSKGLIYYLNSYDRVSSTFSGHYDLAVYLMMIIIILSSATIYLVNKIINKGWIKTEKNLYLLSIPLFAILLLSGWVLIMTAARFSFVALVAGIILLFLLTKNHKYFVLLFISLIGFLIVPSNLRDRMVSTFTVYLGQGVDTFSGNEEQQKRYELNIPTLPKSKAREGGGVDFVPDITPGEPTDPTQIGVYRSLSIRLDVEWPRALRSFAKNPLLGTGYSSIDLATDNDILRSLGEVGILGTFAFFLILYEVLKRLVLLFHSSSGLARYLLAGVLSMVLAFIANSLFIDVFEGSKIAGMFWLISGITLAYKNT